MKTDSCPTLEPNLVEPSSAALEPLRTTEGERRVLIIDDTRAIHDDFRKILRGDDLEGDALDQAEAALLGGAPAKRARNRFTFDSAYQGNEGLALVEKSVREGKQYEMAFVDVRMPPGWDGVETTLKLWEVDPDIQVVICTAYSDYSWTEMMAKLGHSDRLVILKKPFDTVEVLQLANALTEKWRLLQVTRRKLDELEQIVHYRTLHLKQSNAKLEHEIIKRERRELCLTLQHDVTRVLADSTATAEVVTERILQIICAGMKWDVGELWSVDRQADVLRVASTWHRPDAGLAGYKTASQKLTFARGQGLPGRVWSTGGPTWVSDTASEKDSSIAALTKSGCLRAAFAFPVRVAGEVLGVLSFLSSHIRQPQADVVEMFATMSSLIGQSLERRRLEEQLRQSQKMDAVGRLAGGVAHDFNNVLTVIQGYAEIILMTDGLPAETLDGLNQIQTSAQRAASLTRQLLTFSRRQVIQLKALDLNLVVGNLAKMVRRIIGEDISLSFNYSSDPTMIKADENMIGQIMLNLTVNARDAMPGGGKLLVRTENLTLDDSEAKRSSEAQPGQFVCLTVSDNGCGIKPEHLLHIFEPFYTTKEAGRGTGLGLATVHGIVAQHRGWIEVESKVSLGTTFRIFLPRGTELSSKAAPVSTETTLPGGTETILLVEDEAPVRRLSKTLLERLGYSVLEASSGLEALTVWDKRRDDIDLVLTDVVMPDGVNGRELVARLRADRPQLRFILTSGYTFEHEHEGESWVEGRNFLQKPYHPRLLAQTVRERLDRKPAPEAIKPELVPGGSPIAPLCESLVLQSVE